MTDNEIRKQSTDWIDYKNKGGKLTLDQYITLNRRDDNKSFDKRLVQQIIEITK